MGPSYRITMRHERPEDVPAIRNVIDAAFANPNEADLVDRLRDRGTITVSLVAEHMSDIVGHVCFSPVTIHSDASLFKAVGLGPVSVLPEYQRRGIGSLLVLAGLKECRRGGHKVAVVLGEPGFYLRLGFVQAKRYGIQYERDVPQEYFMAAELCQGALRSVRGIAEYQPEFGFV